MGRISNIGGGEALQVDTLGDSAGATGIRVNSLPDSIFAEGRIITQSGFHGPCNFPNCNSDVAEAFTTAGSTEPGDVVALIASDSEPTVEKVGRPYDPDLVGVVSTSPGLVLDHGMTHLAGDNTGLITPTSTIVGMVGRVPTKVTMENGPIAVGDALTSSNTDGTVVAEVPAAPSPCPPSDAEVLPVEPWRMIVPTRDGESCQ
jgi:hypothetical protein